MKLTKIRIYNYKSIIDSGDIDFSADFLTLLGKNESGKTAILEALRDFDRDQSVIDESAYPLSTFPNEPLLQMKFIATSQECDAIERDTAIKMTDAVRSYLCEKGFHLRKTVHGEYQLEDTYLNELFNDLSPEDEEEDDPSSIGIKKDKLDAILSGYPTPALALNEGAEALDKSLQALRQSVKSRLLSIRDEQKREDVVQLLRDIIKETNDPARPKPQISSKAVFINSLVAYIPRFLFFDTFSDILPFDIPIKSLKENQAVLDFARIAKLDLDELMNSEDLQRRINMLNRHSATISGDFLNYWEQNQIELIVRPEGDKLLFGVKEVGSTEFFKVEQRSKGFQWFLSFYLKLNSYQNQNIVLLIDEPGQNLHPKAHKDILNVLSKIVTDKLQVIFSTHSSYLIDPDRLDRIRLVIKDKTRGTMIEANLQAQIDEETMLPVKAAMGARLSDCISQSEQDQSEEEISEEEISEEEIPEEYVPVKRPALFGFLKRKEQKQSEIVKNIIKESQSTS